MQQSCIDRIEDELGVELPEGYKEWLRTLPLTLDDSTAKKAWEALGEVFLSADPIIELSNSLIGSDWLLETEWEDIDLSDYLVVAGDGCGNYYLIDCDEEVPAVHFLCHDPVSFDEDSFPSIADFCAAVDQAIR